MRVEISVGGGAWVQGGVTLPINQSVSLRLSSTSGVTSIRWEIYEYPEAWTAPVGWSTDGNGVIYALTNGTSPPDFTPATVASGWGKWLIRIFANGSGVPSDDTAGLSIVSPNGFEDVAFMEKNQFDTARNWIGALKRTIRTMDAALTAGGGGSGGGGSATNPPSGTGSITGFDENHIYVWDMSETSNTSAFAQNGYGNASLGLSIVGCSPGFLTTMGPAARFQVAASGFAYATRGYFGPVGNTYELLYAGFTGVDASFFTAEFLIQPLTANMVGEFFLGDAAGDNKVQIVYANTGINARVRSAAGTELRFWAPGDAGVVTVDGESVYGFAHSLSAWHHVMLTGESGTWKLYVDGVLIATRTGGPAAPSTPGMNPRFGVNKTGDARSLGTATGAWAYARNVRISKCARTLTYAQQVYNAAVAANQVVPVNPGPYVPPPYTSPVSNPAGAAGNYAVVDSEHIYAWDMDGGGVGAWYNNTGHGTLSTVLYPKGIAGSTLTALGQAQLFEPLPYAVAGRIATSGNYYAEYVAGGDDMLIYDEKWFSVEFLIQPRTAGMIGELFIGKGTSDKVQILYANTGVNVRVKKNNGSTTTFFVNGDANTSTVETQLVRTLTHALNVWHHVLLTCENGDWKLYADGVLLKTVTGGPLAPNAADMAIRFGADKASNTFSIPASGGITGVWGACRNLRISKCARTATYAQEVCTSASVGVAPPLQAGGGTGTVQVWAGTSPGGQSVALPNNQSSKVQTYTVSTDSWTNNTNFSSFALAGQSNVVAKNNVAWFLTNGSGGSIIRLVSSNATTGVLSATWTFLPDSNNTQAEPRFDSGIHGLGISSSDVIYTLIQRTYNSTQQTTANMYNDVILYSVISQIWAVANSHLTASMDVSSYTTLNSDSSKLYYFETGHQYGGPPSFPATTQKLHLYSLPTTTNVVASYGVNGGSYDGPTFASATPSGTMASSTDLYFYTVPNDLRVSKMATATGVITARSTLPATGMYYPGAAWSDGCIQFSGGAAVGGTLLTTVWRYDINADAYITKTALPGATCRPASVGV